MRVECECGKALKVSDTLIGKRVRCPECRATLLVEAEPDAIVATRSKRGAAVAEQTPPPRKRRPMAQEEEAAAPARKRNRNEDEDEDDRPRKKKKTKKSGGVPLWLILGGAAALVLFVLLIGGGVGAYFLFFRGSADSAAGVPSTGPGSKNEPVVVKLEVPAAVGDAFEFNVNSDENSTIVVEGPGQPRKALAKNTNVRAKGAAKVLGVEGAGTEARTEYTLATLSMDKGQGDTNVLPPNTSVIREQRNRATASYSRKDGNAVNADALLALQEAFGKGGANDMDFEGAFGTKQKKAVGDSWSINRTALVQSFNKSEAAAGTLTLRDEDASGTVKLAGVTTEDGIRCLLFEITVIINKANAATKVQGMEATLTLVATMNFIYCVPADYSTPAVRQTMRAAVKTDSTVMGPTGAVNLSVVQAANKTSTRKYTSAAKKSRVDLGPRAVDGMPRLELALSAGETERPASGVFAPLVGASVFKTAGGLEQRPQWVRFPYTPAIHRQKIATNP